jgi:hypothetical protein
MLVVEGNQRSNAQKSYASLINHIKRKKNQGRGRTTGTERCLGQSNLSACDLLANNGQVNRVALIRWLSSL